MSANFSGLTPSFQSKSNRPTFLTDPSLATADSIGFDNAMAFMSPMYEPLPTMFLHETFPEKQGHHQHHIPLPWWRHKVARWVHNPDVENHIPNADVRETPTHYYLDVELPGFKDKSKLSIRWTSTRTVLIQARIERPYLPEVKDTTHEREVKQNTADKKDELKLPQANTGQTASSINPSDDVEATKIEPETSTGNNDSDKLQTLDDSAQIHLTVGERAIGYFIRNFNFPIDVEYEHMKAKLEAGLLTLSVEKAHTHRVEEGKETVMVH